MRVVHVSFSDLLGGANIAAHRVHRALLAAGVDSIFVCQQRFSTDPSVHVWPVRRSARIRIRIVRALTSRAVRFTLGPTHCINLGATGMDKYVASLRPDVVHLHWVCADTLSLREIARLGQFPLVWFLHDLWPCTATEGYPVDDRFVTGYGRETNLIERWYWRKKCKQLQYLRPWLVGPSNWTIGEARRAILWRDRAQFACIPYPLDTSPFSPRLIADARRRVGIPEDAHVVLFGCVGGTRSPIKGFSLLADALGRVNPALRAKMQVLVFGEECRTFEPVHGVPVRGAGIIHDVESLAWLYAAADVFAFPSRKETFGQTKIEALASGVPVVAFRTTACSDGVQHGETGWVCAPFDTSQFAEGLTYLLGMKESHPAQWTILREKCRTSIGAFAPASIAARWLQAYTDLLKQHRSCNHDEQKQAAAKANIPEAK